MLFFVFFPAADGNEEPVLSKLDDVQVEEGCPLRISCTLAGSPTPKVTWYKDGHQVGPSRDTQVCVSVC